MNSASPAYTNTNEKTALYWIQCRYLLTCSARKTMLTKRYTTIVTAVKKGPCQTRIKVTRTVRCFIIAYDIICKKISGNSKVEWDSYYRLPIHCPQRSEPKIWKLKKPALQHSVAVGISASAGDVHVKSSFLKQKVRWAAPK